MTDQPNDAPMPDQAAPPIDTQTPAPDPGPAPARSSRRAAWIGMGAVLVALGLLMFVPEQGEQDAPPPAADAASHDEEGDSLLVGKPAPLDFTLKDMHGVEVELAAFKGKVILLNFWATWCGPCRAEIPSLVELQSQYGDDLVVLGLSVDDTAEKMKPYAEEFHINYPLLVGNGREDVQDAYGPLWGIPVSVFIGRDGRVAKRHSGIASKSQFDREIRSLLQL